MTTHPFPEIIQYLDLYKSLMVEALLIPDNLDSHHLARAMISTRQHLSERALPERIDNLVPIREVIAVHNKVIPTIIVITKVIRRPVRMRRLLPAAAEEIRSVVLEDLLLLVLTQLAALRALQDGYADRKLRILTERQKFTHRTGSWALPAA